MESILKGVIDNISEGIIIVDTEGIIRIHNKKAREIFGILKSEIMAHENGVIKDGDYVFIVDNKLGKDDGSLNSKDLRKIGIYDNTIEQGDSILCFGIYGEESSNEKNNCKYKVIKPLNQSEEVTLMAVHKDISYELKINYLLKNMSIKINDISYDVNYKNAIGYIVILREGKLIFYQSNGYTARNENLKQILYEKSFSEKGRNAKAFEPIGKFLFDVYEKNQEMIDFFETATGNGLVAINEFMEINGIPTLSSITPIYENNKKVGAMLKVEDITELKMVTEERNVLFENLKKAEMLLENEKIMEKFKDFMGSSTHIKSIKNLAYKSSKTNSSVLILGESGTGKSILAKEIHMLSERNSFGFIHINCASLPESLLESELFGYEGGAFTNSKKQGKIGLLELAHGGTLFLDEIGEITLQTQAKLLNFLQCKKFYRVGGVVERTVDTRIICATNKNLEKAIEEGKFREDLYYRINIIPIFIEPLRNRVEDIPVLVDTLLPKIVKRLNKEKVTITCEAVRKLMSYPWYGNIRELENILEREISLSDSNIIYSKNFILNEAEKDKNVMIGTLKHNLERYEGEIILQSLKNNNGDIKSTMEELGIRKTNLYEKIKRYNINLGELK
jgi:transcriptional regulator with PAS, ATPase and Fis domain